MKRLLIGLLLVALLASGCTAQKDQKVYIVAPLTTTATTTTAALTWNDVANLPVGSEVELTGYCTSPGVPESHVPDGQTIIGSYYMSEVLNYQYASAKQYLIISSNPPPANSHIQIKIRITAGNENTLAHFQISGNYFQEISRTVIN